MRIGFGNLNLMEIEKVIKILKLSAEQIQA
jgi:hypothetical protein